MAAKGRALWIVLAIVAIFASSPVFASIPRSTVLDAPAIDFRHVEVIDTSIIDEAIDNAALLHHAIDTALIAPAPVESLSETRVWVSRLDRPLFVEPVPLLSDGLQKASADVWPEIASGPTVLTPDPLGYVDSSNLYAFCGGDPVNCSDPTGEAGVKDTALSLLGWGVGVVESAGDMVVNASLVGTGRQIKQNYERVKRIGGAYQQGGVRRAAGQYITEWKGASTDVLQSLPIVNTVREGMGIPDAYAQDSFEGGRQVGRTTFSLAGDATLVYGGVKGVQASRAARARGVAVPEVEVAPTPEMPSQPPRRAGTTRQGVTRNNPAGWRGLRDLWDEMGYRDILSGTNRELIAKGRTPVVDAAWVKHFPGDAALMGEQLTLHHIGGGKISVPLPKSRHIDAHKPGGFRRNPGGPGTSG